MQTIKLSTFDRLVNIQQLAETATVKHINKRLLQEQVISNLELDLLNQQLSQANLINRQMLENQIKEIESRERQRFYKDLSFKLNTLVKAIGQIPEPLVKWYFINKYYNQLKSTASNVEENFVEIEDKVFNGNSIQEAENIKYDSHKNSDEYAKSPLSILDESINHFNGLKAQLVKFTSPPNSLLNLKVKPKTNIVRVFGLIIFGLLTVIFFLAFVSTLLSADRTDFKIISSLLLALPLTIFLLILKKDMRWRRSYAMHVEMQSQVLQSKMNRQETVNKDYQTKISELNDNIANHQAHTIYKEVLVSFPDFETTVEKISDLYDRCFKTSNNLNKTSNEQLKKAVKMVIGNQQCSQSFLQRKLSIGKTYATKIISQLEILEVIELNKDGKSYRVIANTMSLDGILNDL